MDLYQLFVRISGDNSSFKQSMQEAGNVAETFGSRFDAVDKKLALMGGLAAISTGAVLAAKKFEDSGVQIQRSTGATGDKLEGLTKAFQDVYTQTSKSAEQVSTSLALLSTRTGATGKDLEALTLASLKLANVHKEDVSGVVTAETQLFGAWSIATNKQVDAINFLRVASQQTGTPVERLTELASAQAPILQKLGYGWQQSVALIGSMVQAGLPVEKTITGLNGVLNTFAKEGIGNTAAAWKDLEAKVQSGAMTFDQFKTKFPSKGSTYLFDFMKQGKTDTDALAASFDDLKSKGADTAKTLTERYTEWFHSVETVAASCAGLIVTASLAGPTIVAISKLAIPAITGIAGQFAVAETAAVTLCTSTFALGGTFTAAGSTIAAAGRVAATGWAWLSLPLTGIGLLLAGQLGIQKAAQSANPKIAGAAVGLNAALSVVGMTSPFSMGQDLSGTPVAREAMGPAQAAVKPAFGGSGLGPIMSTATDMFHELKSPEHGNVAIAQYNAELASIKSVTDETAAYNKETKLSLTNLDFLALKTAIASGDFETFDRLTGQSSGNLTVMAQAAKMAAVAEFGVFGQSDAATKLAVGVFEAKTGFELLAPSIDKGDKLIKEMGVDITALEHNNLSQTGFGILEGLAPYIDKADKLIKEMNVDLIKTAKVDLTNSPIGKIQPMIKQTTQMVDQMFNSMERGMASDIVHWKGFGKTVIDVFQKMGEDILTLMLHALLKPVETAVAGVMAGIAQKLLSVFVTQKVGATGVAIGEVTQDAAVGGAAAAASIAAIPIIGPGLAIEAGLAMAAAIEGTFLPAVMVGAAAKGGFGDIPADMLVQTHAKEMILPADIATPLRAQLRNGGVGGGGMAFNNCTFTGVAKETVTLLANQMIRGARLAGARL